MFPPPLLSFQMTERSNSSFLIMAAYYFLILWLLLAPSFSQQLDHRRNLIAEDQPHSKISLRLGNPLIGRNGRMYACSGKSLFAFDSNGTISWIVSLDYACNMDIAPISDERGKIYLVAEDRILKITMSNIATSKSEVDILFGSNSTFGSSGEIIGIAVSNLYSSVFVTTKNRGLFRISLGGELIWSSGPILYQFGYRQGCKDKLADCYFCSAPVIDRCEGTVYISNNEGQVYSLYIRRPHFRWIQDFSYIDKLMTVVSGNNGLLYVIFPLKAIVIALEVSTGNVLWQNFVGPLRTDQNLPVVDLNGWISIASVDGILYSISPDGDLKNLLESTAVNSAILVSPVLDCSGFAVYISQTVMEDKYTQTIENYTYVSSLKPVENIIFLLAPATGTVYWSRKSSGDLSSLVSKSDLRHFEVDDRVLLAVISIARVGHTLPCFTTRQKVSWTCSQVKKANRSDIYDGNERAILLLLIFQLVVLVFLALCVRFCYVFWQKEKLQNHGLLKFLEKRRSLHNRRKTLTRMITELEKDAAEDSNSNKALEQLSELVDEKEGVERKLSTCYSLGHDSTTSMNGSFLLPSRNNQSRSRHSFHSSRKGGVTIFSTVSASSTSEAGSGSSSGSYGDDESEHIGLDSLDDRREYSVDECEEEEIQSNTVSFRRRTFSLAG